jgi:hypothetical protein
MLLCNLEKEKLQIVQASKAAPRAVKYIKTRDFRSLIKIEE